MSDETQDRPFTAKDRDEVIANVIASGQEKPTKAFLKSLDIMMDMTRDELQQVFDHLTWQMLRDGTPEDRREILATMDSCPCCGRWMGHNNPPADDTPYRRQTTFDFDR
jgi:hypothetical protein